MNHVLKLMSLWQVANTIIQAATDKGANNLKKIILAEVARLVSIKRLPPVMAQFAETAIGTVLLLHPGVISDMDADGDIDLDDVMLTLAGADPKPKKKASAKKPKKGAK